MNTWVCIGSGPSLAQSDIDHCRSKGWSLATVNQGYKLVPDAKVFHALDCEWWSKYGSEAVSRLNKDCKIYTGCPQSPHGILVSFGANPKRKIHLTTGALSGHNLIELVVRENPDRIILLGYDCKGQHFHNDYLTHGNISAHNHYYDSLRHLPIINCTPESALTQFTQISLRSVD